MVKHDFLQLTIPGVTLIFGFGLRTRPINAMTLVQFTFGPDAAMLSAEEADILQSIFNMYKKIETPYSPCNPSPYPTFTSCHMLTVYTNIFEICAVVGEGRGLGLLFDLVQCSTDTQFQPRLSLSTIRCHHRNGCTMWTLSFIERRHSRLQNIRHAMSADALLYSCLHSRPITLNHNEYIQAHV